MNLLYSKVSETLLASTEMACSDMITCTAKRCFSKLLGIVTRVLPRLRVDVLQMYLHNYGLTARR